jgi:hypothetical protein
MEVWKKIEGFENYEVSNLGNVKDIRKRKKHLPQYKFKSKMSISLKGNYYPLAIIVARNFTILSENQKIIDVNYKDGNFLNCNIQNLIPIIKNI